MTPAVAPALAHMLTLHPHLTSLNLDDIMLGDYGMLTIAPVLAVHVRLLTHLGLAFNSISSDGAMVSQPESRCVGFQGIEINQDQY